MALMLWIIKWRGLFTVEGLGISFLALRVFSDGIILVIDYVLDIQDLSALICDVELRYLPNIILLIGLLSFSAGLFVVNFLTRTKAVSTKGLFQSERDKKTVPDTHMAFCHKPRISCGI